MSSPAGSIRTGRLPGLDGLRAVSVSLVVLLHASLNPDFPAGSAVKSVLAFGGFGVEVFFTISGFIITVLLLREESRDGRISFSRFYTRRALRILPPAYAYLAFVGLTAVAGFIVVSAADLAASAFFWRNLFVGGSIYTGHFWSLAIEEQFYLAWPLLLGVMPRRRRRLVVLVLCLVAPFYRQANIVAFGSASINWARADLRYDALLYGVLLALCFADQRWGARIRRVARAGDALVLVSVATIATSFWIESSVMPSASALTIPLRSICVCAVIACTTTDDARFAGVFLNARPVVWFGAASYGIYLWQQVVMYYPFAPRPGLWAFRLALVLVAGAASFALVERGADRVRSRLLAPRSDAHAAVSIHGVVPLVAEPSAREGA